MEMFAAVNLVAVVIATVVTFMGGWLWYSDLLFGKPWRKMMGMGDKPEMKGMGALMAKGVANTFMANLFMAVLLGLVAPASLMAALTFGFLCWVAFVLYGEIGGLLWGNGRYTATLMMINAGHGLMVILVGMGILTYMG